MSLLGLSRPSNGLNGYWPQGNGFNGTPLYTEGVYRIGALDIGKEVDPSALAVIEKSVYGGGFVGPPVMDWRLAKLGTWPLGTDYGAVIQDILRLKTLDVLCIDATGAKPFVDWFRKEAMLKNWRTRVKPINIATSAMREASCKEKGYWSVPKREIVSALVVMEHKHGLRFDGTDPVVKQLKRQLADFKVQFTRSANQVYGAKSGSHDDLVMCLGMAAWWALRFNRNNGPVILV